MYIRKTKTGLKYYKGKEKGCSECVKAQAGGSIPYKDSLDIYNLSNKWNSLLDTAGNNYEMARKKAEGFYSSAEGKKLDTLLSKYNVNINSPNRMIKSPMEGGTSYVYAQYEKPTLKQSTATPPVTPTVNTKPVSNIDPNWQYKKGKFSGFSQNTYGTSAYVPGYSQEDWSQEGNPTPTVSASFRVGGQSNHPLPAKYTSKNVRTSLNSLMDRNYMLYGPSDKYVHYYPAMRPQVRKMRGGGTAYPQQPTAAEMFSMDYIPNSPVGFYLDGGTTTDMIGYPQQPTMPMFFSQIPFHPMYGEGGEPYEFSDDEEMEEMKKGGNWIQKAVNPKHKGWCTPMSKPTCTGKRRQFALMMKKKHGFHKKQHGGQAPQGSNINDYNKSNKDYFAQYLSNNAMNHLMKDEMNSLQNAHEMTMAQMGMEMPGMTRANMYKNMLDKSSSGVEDMQNLHNSMMEMMYSADPHYDMQYKQAGGPMGNYYNPYSGIPYTGIPAGAYLMPMNQMPYYKMRSNFVPLPQDVMHGVNPSSLKNFKYDYRGRILGHGPRKVTMSWDEYDHMNNALNNSQASSPAFRNDNQGYSRIGQFGPHVVPFEQSMGQEEFQEGGVYELSPSQIENIMNNGGDVEFVD